MSLVARVSALLRGECVTATPSEERALIDFLVERRLAAEVSALPGASSLSREGRRSLALERERCRSLAEARGLTRARCAHAFQRAGIPALLLKGEAVVALCHGDPSRRPMADLDVLVAPERRQDATVALLAEGLAKAGADTALHDVFLDPVSSGAGMPRGCAVEVHDDVFERPHPFGVDAMGALQGASQGQGGLHVPRPADALLLTAFAFVFHEGDGRKSWIVLRDLALLVDAVERAGEASVLRERARGAEGLALAGVLDLAWRVAATSNRAADLLGATPRAETWRRALAVRLALREVEATLGEMPPPARALTRRVAVALWPLPLAATMAAFWQRLRAPGGGGAWGRVRRQVRAWLRLVRP